MPIEPLTPLSNFANLIIGYLIEIWDFLILIGRISGVIVTLIGAILWLTQINTAKGRGLVLSGIILSIVVQYFVMYPPAFIS